MKTIAITMALSFFAFLQKDKPLLYIIGDYTHTDMEGARINAASDRVHASGLTA